MIYTFTIYGNPKPQSRPRFFKRGNFTQVYDKDKPDKENFAEVAKYESPENPLDTALKVSIEFYIKRPKNHYRTGKYSGELKDNAPMIHTKKPDIDNYAKFVLDSLTGLYWVDDSQIYELILTKQYGNEPRTVITISE